jgi:Tfp pilus assembly protein PilO
MKTENPNRAAKEVSRLQRLSKRERFLLAAGVLFVIGFVFHQLIADPFLIKKQRLERSLQTKAANVLEMKLLQKEYQQISENKRDIMGRLQSRSPEFSLFTFVEQQIDTVRMKERVTSIKPGVSDYQEGVRQALIDLKIEGIVLAQLVDFLASIESFDKVVFVERIVVQNNSREDGLLDVMLSVLTFEIEPAS